MPTELVRRNEAVAHERIQDRFSDFLLPLKRTVVRDERIPGGFLRSPNYAVNGWLLLSVSEFLRERIHNDLV